MSNRTSIHVNFVTSVRCIALPIAVTALSFATVPAHADVVLRSYSTSTGVTFIGFGTPVAISIVFSVGALPIQLQSVELFLKGNSASVTAIVELRHQVAGDPASAGFMNLGTKAVGESAFATYVFNANTPVSLSANTNYWITLSTPDEIGLSNEERQPAVQRALPGVVLAPMTTSRSPFLPHRVSKSMQSALYQNRAFCSA